MMIALGTISAVSTLVAAITALASSVVPVRTVEMTSSLSLHAVLDIAIAGTFAQISLLSFVFVCEKYRHWRTGAWRSNGAAESRLRRAPACSDAR